MKRLAGDIERAEDEAQERAQAAEEQRRAGHLRRGGVDLAAPEVVPAHDDHHERDQVGRVAEQLEGQLGEKRADAADKIERHGVRPGAEEPDRVGRLVAGERHDPDERGGEQGHAHELADATRHVRSGSTHRSDLHDDGQHERPAARTLAEEAAKLHPQFFLDESLIGAFFDA